MTVTAAVFPPPRHRGRLTTMDIATVLSFWALALLLVVTPGPDWAFVLGHGLRGRHRGQFGAAATAERPA